MIIGKLKGACNLLIIAPRGLECEPTIRKSWAGNLVMCSDFTWAPPSRSNEDSKT